MGDSPSALPHAGAGGGEQHRVLPRLAAGAWLLLLVATWWCYSLAAIRDARGVDHTMAVWAGLAQYANQGVLCPALEHDGLYGGTRYMPVPILLHAAAARATGDYFAAAAFLSCCYVSACLVLLLALARTLKAGVVISSLLLSCFLLTTPVWQAAVSGSPDGLPLALQLAALLCVLGGEGNPPSPLRLIAAALLCALAVFSKLSAVWAPAAIAVWLVRRHPRHALLFVGAAGIAGGILFGLTMLLSEGRFVTDALSVSFARSPRGSAGHVPGLPAILLAAANRMSVLVASAAPSILVLLPFALATCVSAGSRLRARLLVASLVLSGLALLLIFAQDGTYANHLYDLMALITVLLGAFGAHPASDDGAEVRERRPAHGRSPYRQSLGLAVLVAVAVGVPNVRLVDGVRSAMSLLESPPQLDGRSSMDLLDVVPAGSRILSENPAVCVARGETPVVLDGFIFLRAALRRPDLATSLAARISAREFTHIVLAYELSAATLTGWYANAHFGSTVTSTIADHYRLLVTTMRGRQTFYVYVPK